jgi:hypothetical protein
MSQSLSHHFGKMILLVLMLPKMVVLMVVMFSLVFQATRSTTYTSL